MPHYADGTPANVGDVVKGKGYNAKDQQGNLKEIIGVVAHVMPGSTACNIQVMHDIRPLPEGAAQHVTVNAFVIHGRLWEAKLEYGQCDHFVKAGTRAW
jgi:hypothetical protein